MPEHIRVADTEIRIFIYLITRHFIDHRTFQMDDLVMRQRQDIFFGAVIAHCKCHLMMVVFAEQRIQFHIIAEIMHPAHVPLKGKAKSLVFRRRRYFGPCRRFLRDRDRTRMQTLDNGIQMFEEFDRIQILVSAVFVRDPVAAALSIIKIKHRRNRIHTQTVHMKFL